jgi:hypothetical protein
MQTALDELDGFTSISTQLRLGGKRPDTEGVAWI